jgi:hypothetical protein
MSGGFNPGCVAAPGGGSDGGVVSTSPQPAPALGCHWDYEGDVSTPIVVDIDRDGTPEIIVTNYNAHAYANEPNLVRVFAIDSKTCTPIWTSNQLLHGQVAAADFDGDGFPEIVGTSAHLGTWGIPGHAFPLRLVMLDHNGNVLAQSDDVGISNDTQFIITRTGWGISPGGEVRRRLRSLPARAARSPAQ